MRTALPKAMSSHASTSSSSGAGGLTPPSSFDGGAGDGEHFLADASARLAESLDVLATIRTLSELAVESFADGCRITLLDEVAKARGDYPFVHVATSSRDPEYAALASELQARYPFPVDWPRSFPFVIRTGESELTPPEAFTPEALA